MNSRIQSLKMYISKTFGFMFISLFCTFIVMIGVYKTGLVTKFLSIPIILILVTLQIITAFYISIKVEKLSISILRILFFVYTILNGLIFAAEFLYYKVSMSTIFIFCVVLLYFGIMTIVLYFTPVNLSKNQPILIGGIVFLIIIDLLGIFFGFDNMELFACFGGFAILLHLVVRDIENFKISHESCSNNKNMLKHITITSTLQIYLDFVIISPIFFSNYYFESLMF